MKHIKIIGYLCILSIGLLSMTTTAEMPAPEIKTSWSKEEVKVLIIKYATQYGVNPNVVDKVVNCESGYNYKAIGDGGKSHGLSQIYSPAHPTVTKEQAYNPNFALDFMAKSISEGKGKMWTCWRKLKV